MFLGWAVIIIGCIFLLQNLGLISSDVWNIIWPCLIILIGYAMISRKERREERWHRFEEHMHRLGKAFRGTSGKEEEKSNSND